MVTCLSAKEKLAILMSLSKGKRVSELARQYSVSERTIQRVRTESKNTPATATPVVEDFATINKIMESGLYKKYKAAFEKVHPSRVGCSASELQVAIKSKPILGLKTDELTQAFGWRESPQGVEFWKKVQKQYDADNTWGAGGDWLDDGTKQKLQQMANRLANNQVEIKTPVKTQVKPAEVETKFKDTFVVTPVNVLFTYKGKQYTADCTAKNYSKIVDAVVKREYQVAIDLIDIGSAITKYMKGHVSIEDGVVNYKGTPITGGMTSRIIDAMSSGDEKVVAQLVAFFDNLMLNPSFRAVNELFDFLKAADIELSDDGHFYAWKKVRSDYKDIYTGTMDNSPGRRLTMPRNMVEEDSSKTCSAGLHVCSKSYLKHYGTSPANRVVRVKVNPKDVVAIPKDYNDAKMRCSEYFVVADVTGQV